MRQSIGRRTTQRLVLPSLFLAWAAAAATAAPLLALRPGPIDRPLSIATADFDRDGFDDLAIANFQAGTIQILINQRDGTFAPIAGGPFGVGSATFSSASAGPFDMVVTDLNPEDVDGDAVANAGDNCPNLHNPVDATGAQPDSNGNGVGDDCELLQDVDCDGMKDDPIDSDQDGVPDFDPLTLVLDNCPRLPNPGLGQLDADLDGVGDLCRLSPDLIVVTTTQGGGSPFGALRIRLNDGVGGLVTRPSIPSGVSPGKLVVGDFTGDGRMDLTVAVSSVDLMQFLPGAADGMFGATTILQAGDGAQGAEAGDFNGDSRLDLAVANRTADSVSVFLNAGNGLPTSATSTLALAPQAGPVVLLAGLLDAGPFADLVVLSQGRLLCAGGPKNGQECGTDEDCADPPNAAPSGSCAGGAGSIEVFTGSAAGALTAGQLLPLGQGHRPAAGLLRDLDGNATLDLVVGDFTGGQVLIYSGVGDGTFAAAGSLTGTSEPASLAAFDLDPSVPGGPDLAVLDHAHNRVDLYLNGGALAFSPAASTPASAWRDTSAMVLTGADALVAVDIVLLQRTRARLEVLSGIGDGSFRADTPQTLAGPLGCPPTTADATALAESDLRQDGRPDLAVLDSTGGTVTVITSSPFGVLEEQETVSVGAGASRLSAGALVVAIDDYDRDGVPNLIDDCPSVYNPPQCRVTDPACAVTLACSDAVLAPTNCDPMVAATLDPTTLQCDSDRNGVGDHCQVLGADPTCGLLDSDFDSKPDYDSNALATSGGGLDFDRDTIANAADNCPTLANLDQADTNANAVGDACEILSSGFTVDPDFDGVPTFDPGQVGGPDPVGDSLDNCPTGYNPGQEDNDGDHVGNACVLRAALDNCRYTFNSTQTDSDGDGVGDLCAVPPQDLLVPNPSGNTVTLLAGDGTGALRPASSSPLLGLSGPTTAVVGQFALNCIDLRPALIFCDSRIPHDIAVATRGIPGNPSDDSVVVFKGDGLGGFTALPAATAQGDPSDLLVATAQPVCTVPDASQPDLKFDPDGGTDVLAAVEPGTSTLQVLLASSQDTVVPGASPLVPPVAQAMPLTVPAPLRSALFTDLNQDGFQDLVALSSPLLGPSTITLYLGLGNGLFFTDPTFSPVVVTGETTLMAATNVNLKTDSFLPEVVLFSVTDQAPLVLTNTLGERADIDGSKRVDGFDLAILAAAFGATRGEDFILQAGGTLQQSGPGCGGIDYRCLLDFTGSAVPGQDLPLAGAPCDRQFNPLTGAYGLAADVNLDGVIDGEDLAYLASLFGRRLP